MERLERSVIILLLIENLKAKGNWCGETHIQKAVYLLQEILSVNMGFDFILYKHGPYSFDLNDELRIMRADKFLSLEPAPPYGSVLKKGEMGNVLLDDLKNFSRRFKRQIEFISNALRKMGVIELEKLTTAVYITKETGKIEIDSRANLIQEEKPHISFDDARKAVINADKLIKNTKRV